MRIDGTTPGSTPPPPTNPFHLARAYGVGPAKPVQRVQDAVPVEPVELVRREPGLNVGGTDKSGGASALGRLLAGVVPGGVSFGADGGATVAGAALPMYRHPADKNAAATAVNVGRTLDVNG